VYKKWLMSGKNAGSAQGIYLYRKNV